MQNLKEIKDGKLFYFGYDLTELANKYGTPLKITFLDVIKDRIDMLKNSFDEAIKDEKYEGKFIYLNANKANYGKEEIEHAYKFADGLETSSYYDLLLTLRIFGNDKKKLIVSNGYKEHNYIDTIVKASKDGYNIIDIIDSLDEYEYLKSLDVKINVGFRVHLDSLYEEGINDRFGLLRDEILYILNDIKNTKLNLNTVHYHQRGFDFEEDKFLINFKKSLEFYLLASKNYDIEYFDIGGGAPLPLSMDFDYKYFTRLILRTLKEECAKNDVKVPNIVGENGKYSQKDATLNIYKVIAEKKTDKYPWNVVNGSLLIAMPEMYALGEPIEVVPINNLNNEKEHVRLAGVTCDCDDVLFDKETGYFEMPKGDVKYISLLGTGSYQNSMNGKGGIHHCLLPEERDLIVKDGKITERHHLQTIEDVYKLMGF